MPNTAETVPYLLIFQAKFASRFGYMSSIVADDTTIRKRESLIASSILVVPRVNLLVVWKLFCLTLASIDKTVVEW